MTVRKTTTPVRDQVKDDLRKMARESGSGGKLPTVLQLCAEFGVAKATVNSALNELQNEGLITRKRGSGVYVTPRVVQKTIGLVFGGDIFRVGISPFYSMLIDGCRRRAQDRQMNFRFFLDLEMPHSSAEGVPVHAELEEAVRNKMLDGVIFGTGVSPEVEKWLRSQSVPFVNSFAKQQPSAPHVHFDYAALIRTGVNALSEQGCRNIGCITPFGSDRLSADNFFDDDIKSYKAAMGRKKLTVNSCWIWDYRQPNDDHVMLHEEQGYMAVNELFVPGAAKRPDGLLICSDMLTRGAIVGLLLRGLTPGVDVKIATHANIGSPALLGYEDMLTLIKFDVNKFIDLLFVFLDGEMRGERWDKGIVVLKPEL